MRILKVIHTWYPEGRGGTEIHAEQVARALSGRGHQVGVFARTGRPDRPQYEVTTEWQGDVGVTRINNTFADNRSFPWVYRNRRVHEAFERELKQFKPDLVHVHHLTGLSTTLLELAKSQGLPVVMSLHDYWTACPRGQRIRPDLDLCWELDRERCFPCLSALWPGYFREREAEPTVVDVRGRLGPQVLVEWERHMTYVMNLADLLITPSVYHRERMLDLALDPDRVLALPHGLPEPESPMRPLTPVRRIAYLGSVIPVKGVHVLIDAFLRLNRPDLELVIHGDIHPHHEDVGYEERLRAAAEGHRGIRFTGAYGPEDVPELLKDADILVVPSLWWESFCLTLREGLLAGLPVVASDLGAMREALDGETLGVLFRPGDPDDLAAKLTRLIDDDAHRARYLNLGHVVESLDRYVDHLLQVYDQAARLAASRRAKLVVAPPFFPAEEEAASPQVLRLRSVPWERLRIHTDQQGPLGIEAATVAPNADRPCLDVEVRIRDGHQESGSFHLRVDLSPLGDGELMDAPLSTPAADVPLGAAAAGDPMMTPFEEESESPAKRKRRRRRRKKSLSAEGAQESPELARDEGALEPAESPESVEAAEPVPAPPHRWDSEEGVLEDGSATTTRRPVDSPPPVTMPVVGAPRAAREVIARSHLRTVRWEVRKPVKTKRVDLD